MADSLDDFFAKKDKKRGKDKGKTVLSAGALVKELEEGAKQSDYPIRKDVKTSAAMELLGLDANDGDWRDFEDVEKRDYTGLKVKEMSLQDQTDDEQRRLAAEQAEAVPDTTAWKMNKDDPSPATNESKSSDAKQQLSNQTQKPPTQKPTDQVSSLPQAGKPASAEVDKQANNHPNNSDESIKAPSAAAATAASAVSGTSSTGGQEGTPSTSTAEKAQNAPPAEDKKSDKPSATPQPYRPPGYRLMENDVRKLEPIKLSRAVGAYRGFRHGGVGPNLNNQDDFPSLG